MNPILQRLTQPSSYAGLAGLLLFGNGDLTSWINVLGALFSLLAVVLNEKGK